MKLGLAPVKADAKFRITLISAFDVDITSDFYLVASHKRFYIVRDSAVETFLVHNEGLVLCTMRADNQKRLLIPKRFRDRLFTNGRTLLMQAISDGVIQIVEHSDIVQHVGDLNLFPARATA